MKRIVFRPLDLNIQQTKSEYKENQKPKVYFEKHKTSIDLKEENKNLIRNIK